MKMVKSGLRQCRLGLDEGGEQRSKTSGNENEFPIHDDSCILL